MWTLISEVFTSDDFTKRMGLLCCDEFLAQSAAKNHPTALPTSSWCSVRLTRTTGRPTSSLTGAAILPRCICKAWAQSRVS